ncbi:hypothetical protein Tco_1260120 [Tanacetum coccineum]
MIEGTKKQKTYKLIIGSIDVNVARYVLVLPMAVNIASLIFEELVTEMIVYCLFEVEVEVLGYMHDPLVWRLYDTCGVHHLSSVRGHDIFMLVEKEYPLTRGTLGLMMLARLLVDADSEMSRELLRKIFYQANISRQGGLLGIRGFYNLMLLVQVCVAAED